VLARARAPQRDQGCWPAATIRGYSDGPLVGLAVVDLKKDDARTLRCGRRIRSGRWL